jgi:hypothetical protein
VNKLLLAGCNDGQSWGSAVFCQGLLATMKAQQAVAISFVGRRVTSFDVPFFYVRHGLSEAITSLRD